MLESTKNSLAKETVRQILETAIYSGKIMLENGAETYRVEETINRMCISKGIHVESFVVPTGIFVSTNYEKEYFSYVKRIRSSQIDLERIAMVNDFSRKFVSGSVSLEESNKYLDAIRHAPCFKDSLVYLFGGISGGFFTLLFQGTYMEFIAAFITSLFVVVTYRKLALWIKSPFVRNVCGGMVNMVLALIFTWGFAHFGIHLDIDKIVIGSLMPLVPGVALTNALRDSISGDYVSGVSKLSEAFIVAFAIAIGVGIILHLQLLIQGGF